MSHNNVTIGGEEPPITHSGSFNALSYNCGELQSALQGGSGLALAMQNFILTILQKVEKLTRQSEALDAKKREDVEKFINFFNQYKDKPISPEQMNQIQVQTTLYNDTLTKYQKMEQTVSGIRENATSEQQSTSNGIEQFIAFMQKLVSIMAPARG